MTASNELENNILDHIFMKTALSQPAALYAGLSTGTLTDTSAQNATECDYTGYSRKTLAGSDFNAAASGQIDNATAWSFGEMTGGASDTATDFAIGDHATIGDATNMFVYGALDSSLIINTGITPQFAAGALVITLD